MAQVITDGVTTTTAATTRARQHFSPGGTQDSVSSAVSDS